MVTAVSVSIYRLDSSITLLRSHVPRYHTVRLGVDSVSLSSVDSVRLKHSRPYVHRVRDSVRLSIPYV